MLAKWFIPKREYCIAFVLLLSVSSVIAYNYFRQVDQPNLISRLELHSQIIQGNAPSPYRYRILVPFLCEAIKNILSILIDTHRAFLLAYVAFDLFAVFSALLSLFFWLRVWFSFEQALVGVLFTSSIIPVALRDHYFQPWSILEPAFLTIALLSIVKKHYLLLAFIVLISSLNRETALFIPLAFLLSNLQGFNEPRGRRHLLLFGSFLSLWLAIFLGLRLYLGDAPHIETIEGLISKNTSPRGLCLALIHWGLFLGGFWIFAILGLRDAPHLLKRLSWLIPLYLVPILLWGIWYEVRLLMPLYPILIPLGLFYIFPKARYNTNSSMWRKS